MTNLSSLEAAIAADKRRFNIEQMFRDLNKCGYNLEDTNVEGKWWIYLSLLLAIAYTSATIQGQEIKRKGLEKYIAPVKKSGRNERRHSSFYIGLYGHSWLNFKQICLELVTELIKLNRNKLQYYQRGQRAMKRIESTL